MVIMEVTLPSSRASATECSALGVLCAQSQLCVGMDVCHHLELCTAQCKYHRFNNSALETFMATLEAGRKL